MEGEPVWLEISSKLLGRVEMAAIESNMTRDEYIRTALEEYFLRKASELGMTLPQYEEYMRDKQKGKEEG